MGGAMSYAIDEADLIEPQRLAECVVDDIVNDSRKPAAQRRRLTIREMRMAIEFEMQLVCLAASNVAEGVVLSPEDIDRVWAAASRIQWIWDEGLR